MQAPIASTIMIIMIHASNTLDLRNLLATLTLNLRKAILLIDKPLKTYVLKKSRSGSLILRHKLVFGIL